MGVALKHSSRAFQLFLLSAASFLACKDSSSRVGKAGPATVSPSDSVVAWARGIDSLADSTHAREFEFPPRSAEGGRGRLYELADSAVRVDVEDLGEMGRVRRRFYARSTTLRLAVRIDERYDQPMSGNVVDTRVDSTWFSIDTAVKWRDSSGVVRDARDTLLSEHGREVAAEYLWSIRMARTFRQPQR